MSHSTQPAGPIAAPLPFRAARRAAAPAGAPCSASSSCASAAHHGHPRWAGSHRARGRWRRCRRWCGAVGAAALASAALQPVRRSRQRPVMARHAQPAPSPAARCRARQAGCLPSAPCSSSRYRLAAGSSTFRAGFVLLGALTYAGVYTLGEAAHAVISFIGGLAAASRAGRRRCGEPAGRPPGAAAGHGAVPVDAAAFLEPGSPTKRKYAAPAWPMLRWWWARRARRASCMQHHRPGDGCAAAGLSSVPAGSSRGGPGRGGALPGARRMRWRFGQPPDRRWRFFASMVQLSALLARWSSDAALR